MLVLPPGLLHSLSPGRPPLKTISRTKNLAIFQVISNLQFLLSKNSLFRSTLLAPWSKRSSKRVKLTTPFHMKLHIWLGTSQLTDICHTRPLARQSTSASTKLYRGTSLNPNNNLGSRICSKTEKVDLTSPRYKSTLGISANVGPFHPGVSSDGVTGAQTCPVRPFWATSRSHPLKKLLLKSKSHTLQKEQ